MKKINTGDTVQIIAGDEKGKKGKILRLISKNKTDRQKFVFTHAIVEGVNMTERRRKGLPGQSGKVATITKPINLSNIAIFDPDKNKPTRVTIKNDKKNIKQRISVKSQKQL